MRLIAFSIVLSLVFLLAGCDSQVTQPPQLSGIEGRVLLGPQCPVVQEGSPCPDEPFQASVDVFTADRSQRVATFTSDVDGHFRVGLSPGQYYISPRPPDPGNPFPAGAPQTVTVEPHGWTQLTIQYDTGIR